MQASHMCRPVLSPKAPSLEPSGAKICLEYSSTSKIKNPLGPSSLEMIFDRMTRTSGQVSFFHTKMLSVSLWGPTLPR